MLFVPEPALVLALLRAIRVDVLPPGMFGHGGPLRPAPGLRAPLALLEARRVDQALQDPPMLRESAGDVAIEVVPGLPISHAKLDRRAVEWVVRVATQRLGPIPSVSKNFRSAGEEFR